MPQTPEKIRLAVEAFAKQRGITTASAASLLGSTLRAGQEKDPDRPVFFRASPDFQFRLGGAGTGQSGNQITVDEGPFRASLDPGTLFTSGTGRLFSTNIDRNSREPSLSPLLDPSGKPTAAPFGLVSGATNNTIPLGFVGLAGGTPIAPGLAGAPEIGQPPTGGQNGTALVRSLPDSTTQSRSLSGGTTDLTVPSPVAAPTQGIDPAGVVTALNGTAVAGAVVGGPSPASSRSLPSSTTSQSLGGSTAPSAPSGGSSGGLAASQQGSRPGEEVQTLGTVNPTNAREGSRVDVGNGNFGVINFALKGQATQSGLGANKKRNNDTRATNAYFGLDPETGQGLDSSFPGGGVQSGVGAADPAAGIIGLSSTITIPPDLAFTPAQMRQWNSNKKILDDPNQPPLVRQDARNGMEDLIQDAMQVTAAGKLDVLRDRIPDPTEGASRFLNVFNQDPATLALQASILQTLQDPSVLSPEAIAGLKSQARERIQAGQKSAQQQVRQNLASRGILDSGLATSAVRAGAEQAALGTARAERDIDVEAALLNADRLAQTQQLGLGLTGQKGQIGLGALGLGLQAGQAELGAFGVEVGLTQAANQLRLSRDVLVPNILAERDFQFMVDLSNRAMQGQLDAEDQQAIASVIEALLGIGLNQLAPSLG